MKFINLLDKILGINGVIPPNWKARISGSYLTIVAAIEVAGVDVPDQLEGAVFASKVGAIIYFVAAMLLKFLRDRQKVT